MLVGFIKLFDLGFRCVFVVLLVGVFERFVFGFRCVFVVLLVGVVKLFAFGFRFVVSVLLVGFVKGFVFGFRCVFVVLLVGVVKLFVFGFRCVVAVLLVGFVKLFAFGFRFVVAVQLVGFVERFVFGFGFVVGSRVEGDRRDDLGGRGEDLPEGVFDVVGEGGRFIVVVGRVVVDVERDFAEGNVFWRFEVRFRGVDGMERDFAGFAMRRFVREERAPISERLGVFFVVGVLRRDVIRRVRGERGANLLAERLFVERVLRRGERELSVSVGGGRRDFVKRRRKNRRLFWGRRLVEFWGLVPRRFFVGSRRFVTRRRRG